ncbi:MAG TPA: iron ABC transporter permease, partial [Candidatus Ozemobacteraceae bacterium]
RRPAVEAVLLLPGSAWSRLLLRLRLDLPRVLAVAGAGFILSIRELDISLLTVPPGGETLPLRLFNLMHYGAGADVCRIGLALGMVVWAPTSLIAAHVWPAGRECA